MKLIRLVLIAVALSFSLPIGAVQAARDAAFVDPSSMGGGGSSIGGNAVTVEPKSEVDLGDSTINISRRVVFFFVNQTGAPIDVLNMNVNGDGNVTSSIVSDDCSKENKIAPNSRCSVVVSVMPISSGQWSAEVLMTHNGAGRIVKAKISGRTSGNQAAGDHKDAGLSLSSKEVQPINFGDIDAAEGKAVRSALMINDSPDPITILSIDLIAADNGLERLDQGCSIDADLKPGESCPVTLVWKPTNKGAISTDLIIRHSGKLGFVVIPVRGTARDAAVATAGSASGSKDTGSKDKGKSGKEIKGGDKISMPSTADELEKAAGKITALSPEDLGLGKAGSEGSALSSTAPAPSGAFHLIGTVGNRAVLLKPDGATTVAGVGEEIRYSSGRIAKLIDVSPKTADIFVDGEKVRLSLEASEEIISKATAAASSSSSKKNKSGKSGSK